MKWSAKDLCAVFGVDRRTVTNWLNEAIPVSSRMEGRVRVFDAGEVVAWFAERELRHARIAWEKERPGSGDEVQDARDRKVIFEARLLELEMDEAEGRVAPVTVLDAIVAEMGERLMSVVVNLPANYGLHLQRLGIEAGPAETVLEEIAADLTVALRRTADDLEAEGDDRAAA